MTNYRHLADALKLLRCWYTTMSHPGEMGWVQEQRLWPGVDGQERKRRLWQLCEKAERTLRKIHDAALKAEAGHEQTHTCDYVNLPHSGGGTDHHGPPTHKKGGYNICDNCYDAMIKAEARWEQAQHDAHSK